MITTKFAGKIQEVLVREGDTVDAGQVVARMDTRSLKRSSGRGGRGPKSPGREEYRGGRRRRTGK